MYETVLYSYKKKYCRIARFSNENAMMYGLDGLLLSTITLNALGFCLITYFVLYFLYSYKICMIK